MKKILIAVLLVSLVIMQSCSSTKETGLSSKASDEKYFSRRLTPVIDGKMNDWGDTLMSYDASTKSIYSIANDESTLYICIKAADQMQQLKIIQGGMEIWIDDKVKRNKTTGIKFPIGGGAMEMPTSRNSQPDAKQMRQQLKLKMLNMELMGFRNAYNGKQSIYSTTQVKPVIEWDDKGNLIYELAIPFSTLETTVAANLSNISIGFVIKALKMPEGMEGGPGGGMPPGDMQPPSGMRPPGGNMPDRTEMENMMKENSFWTKYTISKQ
jgi:hypothetical protein